MSKQFVYLLFALAPFSSALFSSSLPLTPYPNQLEMGQGVFRTGARVTIEVAGNDAEDRFAASLLAQELDSVEGVTSRIEAKASGWPRIVLARAESQAGMRILEQSELKLPPQAEEEGYILVVIPRQASVVSKTAAGIFYGVQTLRQLLHPVPGGGAEAPAVRVVDWPAVRWRGVSIDISRGPIPTMASFKRQIALLAEFKINLYSLYMQNVFAYPSEPLVAVPDGAITPQEATELVQFARQHHVIIVPQQQTFSHMHQVLKNERYQDMAEVPLEWAQRSLGKDNLTPYSHVLSPVAPHTFTFFRNMFADLASAFPDGPFFHIGADEVSGELGVGQTKPEVEKVGYSKVYIDYLRKIDETLRPHRRRLLFWADIGTEHPEHLKDLPSSMIAVPFDYSARSSFVSLIKPYRDAGIETWVAPGVNNWSRIFPNYAVALVNIRQFVTDGKTLGVTGVFNSTWMDNGESTVNFTWYGLAYGAAHSWQKSVDDERFSNNWDWTFYRADDHHFATQIRNLSEIHRLLSNAVGADGQEWLIWTNALSPEGQELYGKMKPVVPQMRLLAEAVIADVMTNSRLARRNRDLLGYVEFGARRFDYLGLKALYSNYVMDVYSQAQSKGAFPEGGFWLLFPDIRNQAAYLRAQYSKLWLGENRPHFLYLVLTRYDKEFARWDQALDRYNHAEWVYRHSKQVLPLIEP